MQEIRGSGILEVEPYFDTNFLHYLRPGPLGMVKDNRKGALRVVPHLGQGKAIMGGLLST
jgi:hypothetical protein